MIVLSNGYKLPETGDFGDVWFPALEDNVTRVNSHDHDGTDSAKIPSSSVEVQTQSIVSGDFSLVGDSYRATVNLSGFTVDNSYIQFRDPTTREPIYLKYEYVSATSIYVYINIPIDVDMVLI